MDFTYQVAFSYSAFMLLIILLLVYNSKSSFNFLANRLYRYIIYSSLLYSVGDLIFVYLCKYTNIAAIPERIVCRMHWFGFIVFFLFLYYYFYSKIMLKKDSKFKDLFSSRFNIALSIFFCISIIVYFFLPYTRLVIGAYLFIDTRACLFCYFLVLLTFGALLYQIYANKAKLTGNLKSCFIVLFFLLIFGITCQYAIKYVSFLGIFISLVAYILYFITENPDIELVNEISSSKESIEKSNQAKTDFLSNMTYEIKIPMNVIMSICDELINMNVFNELQVRDDIKQISTSGNNLLEIVNNILDISKIETGQDTLHENDYRISELLENLVNVAKSKIGAKPVKLIVNVDPTVSSVLNGDSGKLNQSLMNIMTNACKYTDVGRVTLTLTTTKSSGKENLLFKITDTGTGIKDEDKSKIFSKFSRLENATESEIDGSGLGLVICKQHVELMGGKIWFESQYRVGTSFFVQLPQSIVDATPIGSVKEKTEEEKNAKLDCSAFTALIVDDNNLNIKVAKRLLEKYKFNVESVTSGKDCVYKIKEDTHYDIIFMDHMMPEMDGIETLHILKKLDGYTLPPIIALTANAIAGMREMYLNEGFDDYLSKPINSNELDRVINKFMKK